MVIFLVVLTVMFGSAAVFLGLEFLKKFRFFRAFIKESNQYIIWKPEEDRPPGMYNIVLRGRHPFCALVGFTLKVPLVGYSGFDYYGFVRSGNGDVAVVSIYIGHGKHETGFFINRSVADDPIVVSSTAADQELSPYAVYRPHWYQRLGFYS